MIGRALVAATMSGVVLRRSEAVPRQPGYSRIRLPEYGCTTRCGNEQLLTAGASFCQTPYHQSPAEPEAVSDNLIEDDPMLPSVRRLPVAFVLLLRILQTDFAAGSNARREEKSTNLVP